MAERHERINYVFASLQVLSEVSLKANALFWALFAIVDHDGAIESNPKTIKRLLYPADDRITVKHIRGSLRELVSHQLVGIFKDALHSREILVTRRLPALAEAALGFKALEPITVEQSETITEPKPAKPFGAIEPLAEFSDYLKTTLHESQIAWIKTYEIAWLKEQIKLAIAWEKSNPKRSKTNIARYLNNWFLRARQVQKPIGRKVVDVTRD